jgi:hypothetical protein
MSDMSSDRIEPASRVTEPQRPEPRGQPDSESRRRPASPPEEPEAEENLETPVHEVDRLV